MSESKGAPCIANEYGHRLYGSKFRFHNMPDPFGEVATLRHQLTTAQAENEALRARVAELEDAVRSYRTARLAGDASGMAVADKSLRNLLRHHELEKGNDPS